MRNEIILVGPICSGKTTIAKRLSRKLKIPHFNVDKVKNYFFHDLGYDNEAAESAYLKNGIKELYNYNKIFEFETIKKILSTYNNCIFDIGAGFLLYEDENMQNEIFKILSAFSNKIMILPNPDIDKSIEILNLRMHKRFKHDPELKNILSSTPNYNYEEYIIKLYYKNFSYLKTYFTYHQSIKSLSKSIIKSLIA